MINTVINGLGFEAALLRQPEITFATLGCSFLTITITCSDWRQLPIHTPFMAGSSYPFYSGVAKEAVGLGAKIVETEVAF